MTYLHLAVRLTAVVFLLLVAGIVVWDTFVCARDQVDSTISEAVRIWNAWSGGLVQWLAPCVFAALWLHLFVGAWQRQVQ